MVDRFPHRGTVVQNLSILWNGIYLIDRIKMEKEVSSDAFEHSALIFLVKLSTALYDDM